MIERIEDQISLLDSSLLAGVKTEFPEVLTDKERAMVHAFLVLSHAVLEERLEEAFVTHFYSLCQWMDDPMVPMEVARLTFAAHEWMTDEFRVAYKKRSIVPQIRAAATRDLQRKVAENHGVKEENVQALSKLLGLDWPSFDNAVGLHLADLNHLGSKRGAAGHLSPFTEKATALSQEDTPDDVRAWVQSGVDAVNAIEAYLGWLRQRQTPSTLIADWDGN